MIIDNHTVAIINKVNTLAEMHGMRPYDFVAEVDFNSKTAQHELAFTTVEDHAVKKVEAMMNAIAGPTGMRDGLLTGDAKEIIDALDHAIAKAPKSRIK
jgi:hypothetical protein